METVVKTTTNRSEYFCDICETQMTKSIKMWNNCKCVGCKRDICDQCRGFFLCEKDSPTDRAISLCKSCYKVSIPFKKEEEKMWDRQNEEAAKLKTRFVKACMAAISSVQP